MARPEASRGVDPWPDGADDARRAARLCTVWEGAGLRAPDGGPTPHAAGAPAERPVVRVYAPRPATRGLIGDALGRVYTVEDVSEAELGDLHAWAAFGSQGGVTFDRRPVVFAPAADAPAPTWFAAQLGLLRSARLPCVLYAESEAGADVLPRATAGLPQRPSFDAWRFPTIAAHHAALRLALARAPLDAECDFLWHTLHGGLRAEPAAEPFDPPPGLRSPVPGEVRFAEALRVLFVRPEAVPDVAWLAARAGVSRRTFERRVGGRGAPLPPPGDVRLVMRVYRAWYLLAVGRQKPPVVADAMGYADLETFEIHVRRVTGLAPLDLWRWGGEIPPGQVYNALILPRWNDGPLPAGYEPWLRMNLPPWHPHNPESPLARGPSGELVPRTPGWSLLPGVGVRPTHGRAAYTADVSVEWLQLVFREDRLKRIARTTGRAKDMIAAAQAELERVMYRHPRRRR